VAAAAIPMYARRVALALAAALAAARAAPARGGGACRYDVDCALNGACVANQCACFAGWGGAVCSQLALLPAPTTAAYGGGLGANVSSWGGGAARDPVSGKYILYVSEISRHCGLGTWGENSRCVAALADAPAGPYARARALQAAWCHGAGLARDPRSGTWVFQHMSRGGAPAARCAQCANGTTPAGAAAGACDADADALPYGAAAFTAPGPLGPFTPAPGFLNGGNCEAFFTPDGAAAVACPTGSDTEDSFLSVSTAPSIAAAVAGNWGRLPQTLSVAGSNESVPYIGFHWEDQNLWRDPRGHWHTIMHAWRGQNTTLPAPGCSNRGAGTPWLPAACTSLGGHAFSLDGAHWWVSREPAYTALVEFEGGAAVQMRARERPHLIFGDNGEAAFFLSGVGDPGCGGNTGCPGQDHTFTLAQPLAQ